HDLQVLELPYRSRTFELEPETAHADASDGGSSLVMCMLLPRQRDGLKNIESRLTLSWLQQGTDLRECDVQVHVPKFRIESAFSLGDALASMGMPKAFLPEEADFAGMSDDPEGLYIVAAIHQAFVDVNG